MKALSISTPAELESLVTTAIYSSLITARLSPATNPPTVHVTSVAPLRDVRPQMVSTMISILSEWEGRCGDVIGGIEAEIAKIKAQAAKNRERERERASRLERSIAGWEGDGGDSFDGAGAESAAAAAAGRSARSNNNQQSSGSGGARGGTKFGPSGSKREFSGDDDADDDDGYWDNNSDGGVDARMDIDEGAGAGSHSTRAGGSSARQAKRVLNMGKKS